MCKAFVFLCIFAKNFQNMRLHLIFPALAVILMASCQQNGNSDEIRSVLTVKLDGKISTNNDSILLPGVVKEAQSVKVAFKTAGQLERVLVKEGDYVSAGQLVAVLDASDYQLGVDAAQSQYKQLEGEHARLRKLYERGSLSANEYEKVTSGLEQLRTQLKARQNQVDFTRLKSPASGYVQQVFYHKGEMVDAGMPIFSLLDVSQMQVEVSIPFSVYQQRDKLTGFNCVFNGENYPLHLISISPKTDGTQMYKMLLSLPSNKQLSLASGVNVSVQMALADGVKPQNTALVVPSGAIGYDESQAFVWVIGSDSTVVRKNVALGTITTDGSVEIASGLDGNEEIVRAGVNYLHDGEKVKVKTSVAGDNPGGLL